MATTPCFDKCCMGKCTEFCKQLLFFSLWRIKILTGATRGSEKAERRRNSQKVSQTHRELILLDTCNYSSKLYRVIMDKKDDLECPFFWFGIKKPNNEARRVGGTGRPAKTIHRSVIVHQFSNDRISSFLTKYSVSNSLNHDFKQAKHI